MAENSVRPDIVDSPPLPAGAGGNAHAHRGHAMLTYPLRGLAGEGADHAVRTSLDDLAGVEGVSVRIADARARVTYDSAVVTPEAVVARLHTAGLTHRTRAAGAHTPGRSQHAARTQRVMAWRTPRVVSAPGGPG